MPIISQTTIEQVTAPRIVQTTINWTVQDCSTLLHFASGFNSPKFTLNESCQTAFLTFYTRSEKVLAITLSPVKPDTKIDLIVDSSLVSNNENAFSEVIYIQLTDKKITIPLLKVDDAIPLQNLVENNQLSFVCKIQEIIKVESEVLSYPVSKSLTMVKNFDQFYKSEKFCDLTFMINNQCIRAHSLVLIAISPHFFKMFDHEDLVTDAKLTENVIDLSNDSDINVEILRGFLDYVYGCKTIKELEDMKYGLFIIAKKYEVVELQIASERLICDSINDKNIATILLFASNHKCDYLRKEALKFAKSCIKTVVTSKEFQELSKDKNLMLELF